MCLCFDSPACVLVHNPHRSPEVQSVLSQMKSDTSFRGFFNLLVVVLIAMNLRLVIENFFKYGFLLGEPFRKVGVAEHFRFWLAIGLILTFPASACWIERHAAKLKGVTNWLMALNITLTFLTPCFFIYYFRMPPPLGTTHTCIHK